MAETSIAWMDFTFNPWVGCTKVSEGCKFCYADRDTKRWGKELWGPGGRRGVTSEATWRKPLKWNGEAASAGVRKRVFCASWGDVFEDWQGEMTVFGGDFQGMTLYSSAGGWFTGGVLTEIISNPKLTMDDVRAELWSLIELTPWLDWQLLTKRPENVMRMVPEAWREGGFPSNVWVGTSVENQAAADARIPALLEVPAAVRFLSCEPLIGPVDLENFGGDQFGHGRRSFTGHISRSLGPDGNGQVMWQLDKIPGQEIHWVIVGGESGPKARPMERFWVVALREQCRAAGVAFFMKQGSEANWPEFRRFEALPPGLQVREFPEVGRG